MTNKQTVKFGDICHEVKLTTKDPIADGYERYIGLEHLDSGSLKIKRWGLIAEDNPSFTRVFKKGHILLGKRRPYLKKAAIAEFDGVCSGDIIVIDPIRGHYQRKLLEFVLFSNLFWDWAIKTSSGSLSPRTKFKSIAELEIKLKDINILQENFNIFNKLVELVDVCDKTVESSKCLRQSLRVKLLYSGCSNKTLEKTHFGYLPKGWDYLPLNKIVDINPSYKYMATNKDVTFCEMSLLETDYKFIHGELEKRPQNVSGSKFKNGDVLFARITPCAENGKMAIVDFLDDGEVGKGSTEFIVLSPKKVSSFYLYSLCRTARVREFAIANMEGTTGRQRIPAYIFDNIMIPIPPENEMKQIESALLEIEHQVELARSKKASVERMLVGYVNSTLGE